MMLRKCNLTSVIVAERLTKSVCLACAKVLSVNTDDVCSAISRPKRRKQDGDCGISTDYLIHGTHKLNVHIELLFTTMLKYGVVPNGFMISTIIPIPKSKRKSINCYENYRGIALSNILGKVFDHILLQNNYNVFTHETYNLASKRSILPHSVRF